MAIPLTNQFINLMHVRALNCYKIYYYHYYPVLLKLSEITIFSMCRQLTSPELSSV